MPGKLPDISYANRDLRIESKVKAGFDQRGIARQRNAGDLEGRTAAGKRQGHSRRDIAEGVAPAQCAAPMIVAPSVIAVAIAAREPKVVKTASND